MSLLPTVGAAKLAACGTIEETATTLGASTRAVTAWRSGKKVPNATSRTNIQHHYQIDPRDWDRRELPAGTAAPPEAPGTELPHEGAEARLRNQMSRLRALRQDPQLTERARIDCERLELQCSVRLARIEGQELTPRRILASAAWGQLLGLIEDTLTPHPLALFELQTVLAGSSGEVAGGNATWVTADHPELVAAVQSANRELCDALAAQRARRVAA